MMAVTYLGNFAEIKSENKSYLEIIILQVKRITQDIRSSYQYNRMKLNWAMKRITGSTISI